MLTQLSTDLCRLLRHNYARFDNDASACYDRIIVALGMLTARRCGMPDSAVKTHADCLALMKYTVKTVFGISEDNYRGTPFAPLFGTGQGSGASPSVWLTLIVFLMNTLDRMITERMEFSSPDSTMKHSRLIDAFVDDTTLGFTDPGFMTLKTMITKLNHMAQTWEKLLFYSCGALNLKKCSWHVLYWDWKHGRPVARPITPEDQSLELTTQGNTEIEHQIKRLSLDKSSRIIGVHHLSPDGNFSDQIHILKDKADQFAIRLQSPKLTPRDIMTFHKTTYAPSMRYVLPTLVLDEEELAPVQSQILASILQKLGYSSKLPTSIRHGPVELGGLNLIDLRTELGISTIKIESGLSEALLDHPAKHIPYLTPTWITSIRQFIFVNNLRITLTDSLKICLRGKHDQCIMNLEILQRYTVQQQVDINLVRLYLQIITLSDASTQVGDEICNFHLRGERRPNQIIRKNTWPRQEPPTSSQRRLWRKYITSSFLRYGTKWKNQLGPLLLNRPPLIPYIPLSPGSSMTLKDYIKSLPSWYRRLLFYNKQLATDLEVWRAFRAKRRLIIASDGSSKETAGTFGWKLTTSKHVPLFEGSGPVDDPIEIGSSIRSELGGFTAPLLLVKALARFWGLQHKCSFRWIVDSKVAISRVVLDTRHNYSPRAQPDNFDYLSLITDLFSELRRPLSYEWKKSHQDSNKQYEQLSPDDKLNVDSDHLATEAHMKVSARPKRQTEHLLATKISIQILNTRYYGNIDENLRYHINAGYMKAYLQQQHAWTETTWNTIDFPSFGRFFKTIPLKHRPAHVKFVHDELPLGAKQFKISTIPDPNLKTCPCCKEHEETSLHFLHCPMNTARTLAQASLLKSSLSEPHDSRPALAACIERYLQHPESPVQVHLPKLSPTMQAILVTAIEQQTIIGWPAAMKGYLSIQWLHLASVDGTFSAITPVGRHRNQKSISALFEFSRFLWLGRNEALHSDQDQGDALVYSAESAELRHFHSDPSLLPHADRHYCVISLNRLLRSRPFVRRRWLRRVRTARANFLRDGSFQQNITKYFQPTPGTPVPRNQEDSISISQYASARPTTTQQRMTSYFTGRPPDLPLQLTTNPSLPK